MVSFLTNARSAVTARGAAIGSGVAARAGVSSLNRSPTPTKVSSMSALKQSQEGLAVFDGITGPINTPAFSGAFQLFWYEVMAGTKGAAGTLYPIGVIVWIAADRALPMFFKSCATARIMPRVKIMSQQPNGKILIYTLNNVIIGLLGDGNAGPTAYPIQTYMQLYSGSMTYQF